jgi:hypothetical protein
VHGECRNQDGVLVATGEAKMLAGNEHRPAPSPPAPLPHAGGGRTD